MYCQYSPVGQWPTHHPWAVSNIPAATNCSVWGVGSFKSYHLTQQSGILFLCISYTLQNIIVEQYTGSRFTKSAHYEEIFVTVCNSSRSVHLLLLSVHLLAYKPSCFYQFFTGLLSFYDNIYRNIPHPSDNIYRNIPHPSDNIYRNIPHSSDNIYSNILYIIHRTIFIPHPSGQHLQ